MLGTTGLYWATSGCNGMYWTLLGFTGQYWTVMGCTWLFLAVFGCTGLLCTGVYWAVLSCTWLYWTVLGSTSSRQYWAVLGCTGLYWTDGRANGKWKIGQYSGGPKTAKATINIKIFAKSYIRNHLYRWQSLGNFTVGSCNSFSRSLLRYKYVSFCG